jgi:hypothetical protein
LHSKQLKPVGVSQDAARKEDKQYQKDNAAATAAATAPASESKIPLKPVKQRVEKKHFQQSSQATLSIIHCNLAFKE